MEMMMPPPKARYGVVNLTLPGNYDKYLELGPVLVASYDRRIFEILYPLRAVVQPLEWELLETYGILENPDEAIRIFMRQRKRMLAAIEALDDDGNDGNGAVVLEVPTRKKAEVTPLAQEVAA